MPEPPPAGQDAAARKNERAERRELLYTVVRDAMVRAGVLSAGYKFKVLSLDQRGAQFLVMVDLAPDYGREMARLGEIETLIIQSAKARFSIVVPAVYWRVSDQIVMSASLGPAASMVRIPPRVPEFTAAEVQASPGHTPARPAAPRPQAAPAPVTRPAPLVPPTTHAPTPAAPGFDPIEADEVAAFKHALANAAGASPPAPQAQPGVPARSGPLLPKTTGNTGFEDTVMPAQDAPSSDLSSTQYGDLR